MRKVLEVDILDDPVTQRSVGLWSVLLLVPGLVGAPLIALLGWAEQLSWQWCVTLALVFLVSLPVHEVVHGACFRRFGGPGTRVRFGFEQGMLYATCPGRRFPRKAFVTILLAPLAALTCVYVALGCVWGAPLMAWALVWLHASGCAGDLWFAREVLRHPEADLCEDTHTGFALWDSASDEAGGGAGGEGPAA